MGSSIEWTDVVWNPTVGCSRVSAGCEHCYAERVAHRGMSAQHRGLTVLGKAGIRWNGTVRFLPDRLGDPLRWRKPRRVFVNSMSDLFHEELTNEQIAAVFGVMAASPLHAFQVLTKRPRRMLEWFKWVRTAPAWGDQDRHDPIAVLCCAISRSEAPFPSWVGEEGEPLFKAIAGARWPLPNVWLGVSVEDQETAAARIPWLFDTPAAIRWVSYEPAVGPVVFTHLDAERAGHPEMIVVDALRGRQTDMGRPCPDVPHLDWIVVGGESGAGARGFDLAWARKTIGDCRAAGVPVFCKQVGPAPYEKGWAATHPRMKDRKGGDMAEWPPDLRVREFPEVRRG